MQLSKHSSKWINSAARRRLHANQRARLARMLGWHIDCIATTREMLQTLREKNPKEISA
jgi:hypothetical protein